MIKDIIYQETITTDGKLKIGVFTYNGVGDPVKHLDDAVYDYVGDKPFNEFIDADMDNPWVRVIIFGL